MNIWQGAWHIAKYELTRDRFGMIFTILFCLYMCLCILGVYNLNGEYSGVNTWLLDVMFIVVLPNMAFVMNRTTFQFWRNDTFTGKLSEWRTMPIPLNHLALGRLLQLVIVLAPAMILFFLTQYFLVPEMKETYSVAVFIQFGLFWFFYALGIAVVYVYWEIGHSGKTYSIFCYICATVYLIVVLACKLAGINIVMGVLGELQAQHWWYTAGALAFCILSLLSGFSLIVKRLRTRNFVRKAAGIAS
ncbi:MAG: hypothetical protein ACE3L7_05700 [Candidatus Pristimantibacillus sp.]